MGGNSSSFRSRRARALGGQIEIAGTCGADAQCMDLGVGKAKQDVEDQRVQRLTKLHQSGGRLVEHAPLVRWADDEHAHVRTGGGFDGGPVLLEDVIPVQVDVVESSAALWAIAA